MTTRPLEMSLFLDALHSSVLIRSRLITCKLTHCYCCRSRRTSERRERRASAAWCDLLSTLHFISSRTMAPSAKNEEPETCALCPGSVPPKPARASGSSNTPELSSAEDADGPDLQWIACHKCNQWFHSACVFLLEAFKETIPDELREQAEASGQGAFFDWPKTVDRW